MKRGLLLTFLLAILLSIEGFSQTTQTIKGRVTDAETGQALPGVAVLVKGTTTGTTTGANGEYALEVPIPVNTKVLQFRFIGYGVVERAIGSTTTIDAQLSVDTKQLSEVVVTAFGIEKEEKALSYSVQQVTGEEVNRTNQPNVTNAIQGKVAGVIVRQSSGLPGSSSTITVRGNRSFTGNNQPLYVVDGMPIESNAIQQAGGTGIGVGGVSGTDASARALDINPNDIESISVLKGGAAAALYGVRAANGVVLITTKKGKGVGPNEKARITFNSDFSFDRVSRLPELQDTYAQGSGGVFNSTTSLSWGPRISSLSTVTTPLGDQIPAQVFDNVDPFFETGHTWTNGITVANNGAIGNYAVSLSYTDQEGIIPTTGMERFNGKVGGDFKAGEKVSIGASINYSDVHIDKVPGGSNLSNPLFTLYAAPRTFDLWGTPFNFPGQPFRQVNYRSSIDNPRWSLANNRFFEDTRRVISSASINYKPLDWITLNYRLGGDFFVTDGKEVYELGSGFTGGFTNPPSGGQINDFSYIQNQVNSNLSLTFNRDLTEDLNVTLLLGNEIYNIWNRLINNTGFGIAQGGFGNINNTTVQTASETVTERRVAGFYANAELGFKNFLFVNASARQDYVSNLARGNRDFFYPSVGVALAFTDAFDIGTDVLNFGKIRASYAEAGQAPDDAFITRNVFIQGGAGSGFLNDDIQFPFNSRIGYTLSNVFRTEDLRPQNTRTIEFGGDFRFFDNRLSFDYTYYIQTTEDQIFSVPASPASGFTSEFRNAGKLETTGHELIATIVPVKTDAFDWALTTNFTAYKNEVKELAPGVENIFLGGFTTPNIRAEAGAQYPIIFGTSFVRDDAGNIVVDSRQTVGGKANPTYGMPLQGPAKNIGNVQPDFEITFTNTLTFKNISLAAQLDWRKGGNMYAGNTRLLKLYGMAELTEDRETPKVFGGSKGFFDADGNLVVEGPNDIAVVQGQVFWQNAMDAITESNVYSTSFVRLREVALNYTLPSSLIEGTFIRNASIVLTGRNLFLITDYPNFDPETSVGGASNFQGLEYVTLPQTRSFGAGIKVTF
ncbi:SusC/RagA family TonB-linked outer membrane protein [Pontibacter cellulosilyticus]|uniref:SusC/RagA family TonB-linked outer membrane protein n=1 Tax=Pontibacter cellulosilyticus TaxID=1720253 RepID=A0A923SJ17_9BACT|nr:SusC/RagA family TonB-linked outer membrane protein [Pontibacter cellulosilyticus]MBC5993187.1 SusC/RagA family TonB-linked outer membrane protein [Pontibacter cellulosilyticus]